MPNNNPISTAQSGMNTDLFDLNKSSDIYSFALNANLESNIGGFPQLQNAESNVLATNFPEGFKVIGKVEIQEQNRVLYALVNSEGISHIGETVNCSFNDNSDDAFGIYGCDTCIRPEQKPNTPLEKTSQLPYCSYYNLVESNCLGFDMNYPVNIEYRITDCGVNIYFTDAKNDMRFLYFVYDGEHLILDQKFKIITGFSEGDCPIPIYSADLDCNKINYNSAHSIPCVSDMEVVSGGSLLGGVYQSIIAYADVSGNPLGEYGIASQPIPISTRRTTVETNYPTDKAIAITIKGLDPNSLFGYYNLVIAETINNFTTFKLAGTFPITKTTYLYTGDNNTLINLTPEDVIYKRPFYKTAGSITKSNNFLFFGNVSEYPKPNLQRVANNVIVNWQTVAIPEPVYSKPENSFKFRTFMRDEVYPIGLEFVYDTSEVSCAYTIPGRASISSDLDIISGQDVLQDTSCNNIIRNKRWQVYNTATVTSSPHDLTLDCNDSKCWETGTMAYWESIETYPNDPEVWGDLCGQPIRHHKFPDSCVTHIHDGSEADRDFFVNNLVFPIGIKINHQSVIDALDQAVVEEIITQADRDRIVGYRVVRGNRVGNKSIVAKGLIYDMWYYDKFNQRYYYPNYPYNDLRPDNFISNDEDTYDGGNNSSPIPNVFTKTSRYTFHSPDVHFVNPTIGTELKLETEEYGKSEGYFNYCDEEAKYKLASTFAMSFAFAAGIAAALSATEAKECITYNFKSKSVATELGLTGGITETEYNFRPFVPFGKNSGQYNPGAATFVESSSHVTCKGTTYQLFNPLAANAIMLAIQGVSGFLNQKIYQIMLGLREMEIMKDLIYSLLPYKNYAIQYNSVGKYNNYKCVLPQGNKNRKILSSAYLTSENQIVNEDTSFTNSSILVNNWQRESSVYIQLLDETPLPNTTVIDDSRNTLDQLGLDYDDLNKRFYRNIASYYASVKQFLPDQYGDIYHIDYLETNGCVFNLNGDYGNCNHVFGGDTFINRFALKRKIPFFVQTRFRTVDEGDVRYSELGNVGYPNYYFDTNETILEKIEDQGILNTIISLQDLVGAPDSRLDAKRNSLFHQKGYIHLYSYGIPYFLVESDINVDLRHGEDAKEHDYYPHQSNLDFWLQKKNVDISYDNFYTYNRTYSKQNHENIVCINPSTYDSRDCKVTHPNRVIYYDQTNASKLTDNWIISKGNNFYDFPLSLGKLISIDGIENEKVLVRFENGMQIFNAYDTLKTGAGTNIQLGTGGVFASRPQEFANTTLGYAGSQHKAIIHTEYGHITTDAKRGQIFNLLPNASGLDEISKDGMKSWFKENLPFTLHKQFPNITDEDLDNNFKGVGLTMSFDKRYNRFFITKLDYKAIKSLTWNTTLKRFEDGGQEVLLSNKSYFCDKSWTLSYNFYTKSWVSYHSFIPNYYTQYIDYFQSGVNSTNSSLWSHGVTNKSYQVYYGKLYPFIVETISDRGLNQNFLKHVDFDIEATRFHNQYDQAINRQVTFNKAIVFNQRQNTGLLELIPKNEDDLFNVGEYPKITPNSTQIEVTNSNNVWSFNQFWDNVSSQTNNIPIWLNDCNNVDRKLNPKAFDFYQGEMTNALIRGQQVKVRLIQDKESNYQIIYKYTVNNQNPSVR